MMDIDARLQNLISDKKSIFAIHGGGSIGLGCMADIVMNSTHNYHIVASSSDELVNELINCRNQFWLKHHGVTTNTETKIENVTMINPRKEKYLNWLYVHANLLAICLPEHAFVNVAPQIAHAIKKRYETNRRRLTILILMNKTKNAEFAKRHISKALAQQTQNHTYAQTIMSRVQILPTVVDRIVNRVDKERVVAQIQKQLALKAPKKLTTNKMVQALASEDIKFHLFTAERDYLLYVEHSMLQATQFPDMTPVNNLKQFAEIKNKYMNAPHAILAWLGGLMGCKTIAEAINYPSLLCYINHLMEREIAPILKAEYPNLTSQELIALKKMFISRCKASVTDPIERVGRDPLRKLNRGGRIRGIFELRQKHHLNIATPELEKGMAAGWLYAIKKIDPNNEECRKVREIYQANHNYQSVLCYKGPYGSGNYAGLDSAKDRSLIANVLRRIGTFEKIYEARESLKIKN